MDAGIYNVANIQESEKDGKEVVWLENGAAFLADTGTVTETDKVQIEEYEDFRGDTGYRFAGVAN